MIDPSRNEDAERQEALLREMEDLLQKVERQDAEITGLTPEARAAFERRQEEHAPLSKFSEEIIQRIKDGSMSVEEAKEWSSEVGRQTEEFGENLL